MRFELSERVARGELAEVWRAQRSGTQTEVALKIGHDRKAAPLLATEALHAALAPSPRLPELVDVGWLEATGSHAKVLATDSAPSRASAARRARSPRPFVALRWVVGASLESERGRWGRQEQTVLLAARDIAEALSDLHDAGLAHGDVKPANVIRTGDGRFALIDLGLACTAYDAQLRGATPRYLAQGDRSLGNARARDLLAVGVLLAELASPAVAAADHPVQAARSAELPRTVASICGPLLAPSPGTRPSARWVCDTALALLGHTPGDTVDRHQRQLRATYLRIRRAELESAHDTEEEEVAPWLPPTVAMAVRARAMGALTHAIPTPAPPRSGAPQAERVRLGPLDADQRVHWLAALVGSPAASWPSRSLARTTEPTLVRALNTLAAQRRPALWTLSDVERALERQPSAPQAALRGRESLLGPVTPTTHLATGAPTAQPPDADGVAELSLRVSRVPFDVEAVETVERLRRQLPEQLVLAAADALRLAGELGRARSLVLDTTAGRPVVAEVLRRAGDLDRAQEVARECLEREQDPDGRARASLARIYLDDDELDQAAALLQSPDSAPLAEVAAQLHTRRGDRATALEQAERGMALAVTAEQRARLAATAAFIRFPVDPQAALLGFRAAVAHALQAGAIEEEATYRTGEAAACVDLGELEAGVATARRAAVLWDEVLHRPGKAARALLACASAFACVDARLETQRAAELAILRARDSGDARAEAYAWWAIADVAPAGDRGGRTAAEHAARLCGLLESGGATIPLPLRAELDDDALHAAARLWRHRAPVLTAEHRHALDAAAIGNGTRPTEPRLAWWGARATRLDLDAVEIAMDSADAETVVRALAELANKRAPVAAMGKAMHAACQLATRVGDVEARPRLEDARTEAARRVIAGSPTHLAEAARSCTWVGRSVSTTIQPEQAVDLQRLVRALGERGSLRGLLDRVVDVLVMWTGAERGLLLLRDASGALTPRSARNLSRDDLDDEQLTLSRTLAQQALETAEPVVAMDAVRELSRSHRSVHALKLRSVLTVPLIARGDLLGVVYLDDRMRRGAFGPSEVQWAETVAPVAAMAIADAAAQDQLRRAVRRAHRESRRLEVSLAHKETALDLAERELAKTVGARTTRFRYDEIVGESEPMRAMLQMLDRISVADVPVLLRGESGSGKELVARAIHRHSPRGSLPFVSENCGALPETLLESALFGHARGAFTGAQRSRVGLFEAADGGTLFLDEIGEMSLNMQTKLLRVIEDGIIRPLGSEKTRRVDVRIIAATHRDLEQMVAGGAFREDLYYRLNVVGVSIPALRERPTDIPLLVRHLLAKHGAAQQVDVTPAAMTALCRAPWPGNVRQLENEIRRALVLSDGEIDVSHLTITDEPADAGAALGLNIRARVDRLEIELVREALTRTGGNQTRAAKLLGISRYGLHKMMKRLGIQSPTASKS